MCNYKERRLINGGEARGGHFVAWVGLVAGTDERRARAFLRAPVLAPGTRLSLSAPRYAPWGLRRVATGLPLSSLTPVDAGLTDGTVPVSLSPRLTIQSSQTVQTLHQAQPPRTPQETASRESPTCTIIKCSVWVNSYNSCPSLLYGSPLQVLLTKGSFVQMFIYSVGLYLIVGILLGANPLRYTRHGICMETCVFDCRQVSATYLQAVLGHTRVVHVYDLLDLCTCSGAA